MPWSLWMNPDGTMPLVMRKLPAIALIALLAATIPAMAEPGPPRRESSPLQHGDTVKDAGEISLAASRRDREKGHEEKGHKKGGHSEHDDHDPGRERGRRPSSGPQPDRSNNALDLLLVLGLPALIGALGGRALRARTLGPAG